MELPSKAVAYADNLTAVGAFKGTSEGGNSCAN